jgi:hypothetical protein
VTSTKLLIGQILALVLMTAGVWAATSSFLGCAAAIVSSLRQVRQSRNVTAFLASDRAFVRASRGDCQ